MDDATLARHRSQLEQRLAEVEAADDLGRSSQDVVTLDQQAVGRLSRQDALMNQSMAKATQARRETEARRIRMALRRIDDDEFGYAPIVVNGFPKSACRWTQRRPTASLAHRADRPAAPTFQAPA